MMVEETSSSQRHGHVRPHDPGNACMSFFYKKCEAFQGSKADFAMISHAFQRQHCGEVGSTDYKV